MSLQPSKTVTTVLKGQLCTGCGLCASVAGPAMKMGSVAPGYSRPANCGPITPAAERTIAAACPGAVVEAWAPGPQPNPYWGPSQTIATGYATDPTIRFAASSGGALSALLIHALDKGLVDRVLHIEADPERPTRNIVKYSRTAAEVLQGAGSRYAASSPLETIEQALSEGGAMAFVGKPCDVSALRRLARVDPRVDQHIPIMLSFFCGGLPSHNGADRIVRAMGLDPAEVTAFRYRGNGWPGHAAATTRDGRTGEMSYADSWGGHLSKEVQFRCKICPDAVGGVADIACADAWYGDEAGYPSFQEQEGRSLIMARSAAGQGLFDWAVAAGVLQAEPLDAAQIDRMQPSQARRKRLVRARMAALVVTLQPRPDVSGVMVGEAAKRAGPREALQNFLGSIRRILVGRR